MEVSFFYTPPNVKDLLEIKQNKKMFAKVLTKIKCDV